MRPAPGHGARAVGKKAKKKPEATSAGEAPVPDPGEGATLAQPEGAPGPAEGAAGPPALSAAPLPLDGLPAPDLGPFSSSPSPTSGFWPSAMSWACTRRDTASRPFRPTRSRG